VSRKPNFRKGVPACFAPPLTAEKLVEFRELKKQADAPVADAMEELIVMVETFLKTGKSKRDPEVVPMLARKDGKTITKAECVPLEDKEVERIWDVVPWEHEINAMADLFESLPNGDLRNAAFHLIWYARELVRDREPMTNDTLKE